MALNAKIDSSNLNKSQKNLNQSREVRQTLI